MITKDSQVKKEPVLKPEVPAAGPAGRPKLIHHVKDRTTSPLSTTKTNYLFTLRSHIHAHTYVQYWYEDWPQTRLNFIFINTAMLGYAISLLESTARLSVQRYVSQVQYKFISIDGKHVNYSILILRPKWCLLSLTCIRTRHVPLKIWDRGAFNQFKPVWLMTNICKKDTNPANSHTIRNRHKWCPA